MSRRAAAFLPYAVFLLLTAISWNRWVEPYVDSGRELMVPWRVAQGEALYRDVRFYYGPLAPWLAAGVDLLAGRSFPARFALAGIIAIFHLEALRRLAGRALSPGRAGLVTAVVVATCFFLRPGGCHLFPYSLDTSLAVAAVTGALLLAAPPSSRRGDAAAAFLLLAALLSRPEIGLVGIAAITLERIVGGAGTDAKRRLWTIALVPITVAGTVYLIVSMGTPFDTLKKEGWLTFLFLPREFRSVYSSFAGVDRPALRAAELALTLIVLLAVGVWILLAGLASARANARSRGAAGGVEAAAAGVLAAAAFLTVHPPDAIREVIDLLPPLVRAVPPLLFAVAAAAFVLRRSRRDDQTTPPASSATTPSASSRTVLPGVPDSVLLVALFFGARLFLAAGYVGPYNGFYLPLPLLVVTASLVRTVERVPTKLVGAAGPAALSRITVAALAVFLAARIGALSLLYRHAAWSEVATPAGSIFIAEPVAGATRAALSDLARRVPEGRGMTGFPETGFLNWSLGRRNPLAQDQFFPGHLDAAAEEEAIARLDIDPPAGVVYVDVLTIGHGPAAFGRDYLSRLDAYVRENFVAAASWGPGAARDPRIGDPRFFIQVRVPKADLGVRGTARSPD